MNDYNIFIHFIAGFITTFAFAIFFNAPKKSLLSCSLIGALGWSVYIVAHMVTDIVLSTLLGAICVGILASSASKRLLMPATIFIYTGIIPLVPGYGMYHAMQHIVTQNYSVAVKIGIDTVLQAGAIAMGILIASVFSVSINRVKLQRKR